MDSNKFKVIQLVFTDGTPIGLYLTERTSLEEIQNDFDLFFQEAIEMEEEMQSIAHNEDWDVHTYVDEKLETRGVYRTFSEEVITNVLL